MTLPDELKQFDAVEWKFHNGKWVAHHFGGWHTWDTEAGLEWCGDYTENDDEDSA